MSRLNIGDKVMFSGAVCRRLGLDSHVSNARGVIEQIYSCGKVATVNFNGSYNSEDGRQSRGVPVANLVKVKSP